MMELKGAYYALVWCKVHKDKRWGTGFALEKARDIKFGREKRERQ